MLKKTSVSKKNYFRSSSSYMHGAFTLIEVMIAVLIISVVILALLEMNGNNSFMFSKLVKSSLVNQYASFFISNPEYGFEKKNIYMDELVKDFKVHDDLRRKLKEVKIEIIYQEVQKISMSDSNQSQEDTGDEAKTADAGMFFEVGKTILKLENVNPKESSSTALVRLRVQ